MNIQKMTWRHLWAWNFDQHSVSQPSPSHYELSKNLACYLGSNSRYNIISPTTTIHPGKNAGLRGEQRQKGKNPKMSREISTRKSRQTWKGQGDRWGKHPSKEKNKGRRYTRRISRIQNWILLQMQLEEAKHHQGPNRWRVTHLGDY